MNLVDTTDIYRDRYCWFHVTYSVVTCDDCKSKSGHFVHKNSTCAECPMGFCSKYEQWKNQHYIHVCEDCLSKHFDIRIGAYGYQTAEQAPVIVSLKLPTCRNAKNPNKKV